MSAQSVDVLAVWDAEIDAFQKTESMIGVGAPDRRAAYTAHLTKLIEARAAVAELIDAINIAVRQNEHDMLMTGDELRACRAALARCGVQS